MAQRVSTRTLFGCMLLGSFVAGCTSIYQVRGVEEQPVTPGDPGKEYFFLLDELEDADPDPDPAACTPEPEKGPLPARCLPPILKDIEARSVEPLKLCKSGKRRCFDRDSRTCWELKKWNESSEAHTGSTQSPDRVDEQAKCEPGPDAPPPGYREFKARPFKIGVLEVNRDGSLNPKQKAQVFDMLDSEAEEARKAGHNLVILLFIHGWHHGAAVCDTNLNCFRRLVGGMANAFGPPPSNDESMDDRAAGDQSAAPGRIPVRKWSRFVGIYFAWRGESIDKEKSSFSWLTIWNRKRVAQDIGRSGGTNLLLELDSRYRSLKTKAENPEKDEARAPSKVLMVSAGHSLGGAMLLSALQSKLVGHVGDHEFVRGSQPYLDQQGNTMPEIVGFGDLSILLNPAVEAARYEAFDRNLRAALDKGWKYSEDQMPVLLAMTSTADKADRVHFPIHRLLLPAKERLALGHYKPFRTHTLRSGIKMEKLKYKPPCGCDGYVAGEYLRVDREEEGEEESQQVPLPLARAAFGEMLRGELESRDLIRKEETRQQPKGTDEPHRDDREPGDRRKTSKGARDKVKDCDDQFCLEADVGDKWKENSPFWVIRTDESVIKGHNDLWDRSLQTFLAAFLQVFLKAELEEEPAGDR